QLGGAVARAVVDHDELVVRAREGLLGERLEQDREAPGAVARGHHDAHPGRPAVARGRAHAAVKLSSVASDRFDFPRAALRRRLAVQRAFTIELALSAAFAVLVAILAPAIAAVYGSWRLAPLMLALAYLPIAFALQSPAWVFFRRMDFVRQRGLQAVVPLATFAATVTLVAAGVGVWGLVLGALAGNLLAAW